MQLNELQRAHKNKSSKRVGRGGVRGKTSGRGHKGQKARAGHSIRPEIRDAIKKIPKKRGHGKNRARTVNDSVTKPIPINIAALESVYESGDIVTPSTLRSKGLVRGYRGKNMKVKILGQGSLTKKLSVANCLVSKSAREHVEKAGGAVN